GACIPATKGTQCAPSACGEDEIQVLGPAVCDSVGDGVPCPLGDRLPLRCSPYRCIPALGACRTDCNSVSDCAPPYVCDPSNRCVPPPKGADAELSQA